MLFGELARVILTEVDYRHSRFSSHPHSVFFSLDLLEETINQRMKLSARHWASLLISNVIAWSTPSFLLSSLLRKVGAISGSYVLSWLIIPPIHALGVQLSASDFSVDDFELIHAQVQSKGVTRKTQQLIELTEIKLQRECSAYASMSSVLCAAFGASFGFISAHAFVQNGSVLMSGCSAFMSLWLAHLSEALGALVYQKMTFSQSL